MSTKEFDASKLQAFGNAAAGHEGVLSDESGAVVVKPCTAAEVAFYTSIAASHPDFLPHVPVFMGSLSLSDTTAIPPTTDSGTIETASGTERLHGKKLATDLHIVLENATHGFTRPNVLDLKLGARLWDDDAKEEKRARLDKVSAETTSGSLGFRIAGMRTWMGDVPRAVPAELSEFVAADKDGYWVFNKMYGRKFAAGDVREGFDAYLFPQGEAQGAAEHRRASEVLAYFLSEVKDAVKVLEGKESRMYSASILLVYEGDAEAYERSKKVLVAAAAQPKDEDEEDEDEDEDEDQDQPKLAAVKLIDFAHASWCPGQGPDENALRGMRATVGILEEMLDKVEKES